MVEMKNRLFYKTVKDEFSNEIEKIKGSRFIAYIYHVESKKDIEDKILLLKKKYYDARHHCYAYSIGRDEGKVTKYNDDGEPSQTAGAPIFSVLNSYDITDVLIVVIRYFGGVKLGKGGLIRAYTNATKELLEISKISEIDINKTINVQFSYDFTQQIFYFVSLYSAKIIKQDYNNDIVFEISLNSAFVEHFKNDLIEKSNGKIIFV
jgi:uncharacterized YigZ family protein